MSGHLLVSPCASLPETFLALLRRELIEVLRFVGAEKRLVIVLGVVLDFRVVIAVGEMLLLAERLENEAEVRTNETSVYARDQQHETCDRWTSSSVEYQRDTSQRRARRQGNALVTSAKTREINRGNREECRSVLSCSRQSLV